MGSPLCFLRNPFPWIAAGFVLLLIFSGFLSSGFSSFLLTSTVLILSTIYFSSSNQKPVHKTVLMQKLVEDAASKLEPVNEAITQDQEAQENEIMSQIQENADRSLDCSAGSISDEGSLIEIALPSGQYVGPEEEEEPKINLQKKLSDFSTKSLFQQHSLMELLAELNEINEEENLIEIDISMGSIKCVRFEFEA